MADASPRGKNRTRSLRRLPKSRVRVTCRRGALDLGPNVARSIVDLSLDEIQLVVKEALEPGGQVSVGLEGQTDRRPTVSVGKVVWCNPTEDGAYWADIQFEKPLPYAFVMQISWLARTGE
jgi:hypothetical protein